MTESDTITMNCSFAEEDVNNFLKISRDSNLVHTDEEYADSLGFEKCIVPGMMTSSLIGGIIGTKFPGNGTIYLGQTLKFLLPVYVNEEVKVILKVTKVREDKPIATIQCEIHSRGSLCITGEAVIKIYP